MSKFIILFASVTKNVNQHGTASEVTPPPALPASRALGLATTHLPAKPPLLPRGSFHSLGTLLSLSPELFGTIVPLGHMASPPPSFPLPSHLPLLQILGVCVSSEGFSVPGILPCRCLQHHTRYMPPCFSGRFAPL